MKAFLHFWTQIFDKKKIFFDNFPTTKNWGEATPCQNATAYAA